MFCIFALSIQDISIKLNNIMAETVKRASKPAAPKSKPTAVGNVKPSKRPTRKAALKPTVFAINRGGGIWCKIPQKNIIIFDEEKGYNREIRFARGERSIYVEEQSSSAQRQVIVFRDKVLSVLHTQPELLTYLRAHPSNVANGGSLFSEVNLTVNAKKEVEDEFLVHDAISLIRSTSTDELMPMVLSYGIDPSMGSMEIKKELLKFAKSNATSFMELFNSPIVQVKADVLTGVDFQILSSKPDGMYWGDNNSLITPTPMGQNSIDVFSRFLMTDRGAQVREELKRQIDML
tara:strand:+ start:9097 stop:9969 length:873 start_codon:yes stop_codon:yes gene_type:complete